MTPEQLQELRQGLPAFADANTASSLLHDFCRYYGIDFSDSMPSVDYQAGTVSSGNYSLVLHRWLQTGASSNLVLVHGYYDHSGLFGKLINYGLSRNCNVLIFDLPGHGLSSGEPAVIDDFADYGRAIAAVLGAARMPKLPQWVMAQSTGCSALVEYARVFTWPFSAAVLLAPLARPMGWKRGRLLHSLLRPFADDIERKFVVNSSDPEFLQFQQRDPLQCRRLPVRWVTALRNWLAALPAGDLGVGPALIVQGDADETVDWIYNLEAYQDLFPGSQVIMLPQAGHQLANESLALRESWLGSVDHYLSGLGLLAGGGSGSL